MELTIVRHPVADIQFGEKTRLDDTTLIINEGELRAHLLEDDRLVGADLEIVHPGEVARAGSVFDIIEPRAKAPGGSPDFPGIVGDVATEGHGTTHVLEGAAVTVLNELSAEEQQRLQDILAKTKQDLRS